MQQGRFYFISDDFYAKYDTDKKLMQNKEIISGISHKRPCFYAFPDSRYSGVFWCVPISSKVDKYEGIVALKLEKQRHRGIENPNCNTIRFGEVLGQKRAFLIQNMFPVTNNYVLEPYIDKNSNTEVKLALPTEQDIITNARVVLNLAFRGIKIVYGDIVNIYNDLVNQLSRENITNNVPVSSKGAEEKPSIIAKLDAITSGHGSNSTDKPPQKGKDKEL